MGEHMRLSRKLQFDPRGLVLPVAVLLLWWVVTDYGLVNIRVLVPPADAVRVGMQEFRNGELADGLVASLARNLAGFAIGGVVGLLLGILLAVSRLADHLAGPSFHALKQVAIFAWIPLISAWFGQDERARIFFIALAAFYPMLFNTYEGVRSVSRELAEVTQVFRFSRWQQLTRLILPSATPQIFSGLHLALIYSWLATIGAEYFFKATPGVSTPLLDGRNDFDMAKVLYGMVIIGLVGAAVSGMASYLEHCSLKWRRSC